MADAELPRTPRVGRGESGGPGILEEGDFRGWAAALPPGTLDIWNQAMLQLRHHDNIIWSSVRTFFTINGLLATVVGLFGRQAEYVQDGIVVGTLAVIGLIVNTVALRVLSLQWRAYAGALVRKTVLEHELGFDRMRLHDVDLKIPPNAGGESDALDSLLRDPHGWYRRERRSGRLYLLLCTMYGIAIAIYLVALVMVVIGFISGYFFEKP